jgi:hypothetical protein
MTLETTLAAGPMVNQATSTTYLRRADFRPDLDKDLR